MFKLYEMCSSVKSLKNEALAWDWLLLAAGAGHPVAAEVLGVHCLKLDATLARYWLEKVRGRDVAKKALATMGAQKQCDQMGWVEKIRLALPAGK